MFFVTNLWGEIILIVLSGLASGLNNALFTSHVMEVSPYQRSITSGSYNFVRWMGAALAPLMSGIIGEAISREASVWGGRVAGHRRHRLDLDARQTKGGCSVVIIS